MIAIPETLFRICLSCIPGMHTPLIENQCSTCILFKSFVCSSASLLVHFFVVTETRHTPKNCTDKY